MFRKFPNFGKVVIVFPILQTKDYLKQQLGVLCAFHYTDQVMWLSTPADAMSMLVKVVEHF